MIINGLMYSGTSSDRKVAIANISPAKKSRNFDLVAHAFHTAFSFSIGSFRNLHSVTIDLWNAEKVLLYSANHMKTVYDQPNDDEDDEEEEEFEKNKFGDNGDNDEFDEDDEFDQEEDEEEGYDKELIGDDEGGGDDHEYEGEDEDKDEFDEDADEDEFESDVDEDELDEDEEEYDLDEDEFEEDEHDQDAA